MSSSGKGYNPKSFVLSMIISQKDSVWTDSIKPRTLIRTYVQIHTHWRKELKISAMIFYPSDGM